GSEFGPPQPFVAAGRGPSSQPTLLAVIEPEARFVLGNQALVFARNQFEPGLEGLEPRGGQMLVAQGLESSGRQAEFCGPMAVFVFETVERLQRARQVAALKPSNLFGDFRLDRARALGQRG